MICMNKVRMSAESVSNEWKKSHVRDCLAAAFRGDMMRCVADMTSLQLFSMVSHYEHGAPYLSVVDKSMRRVFANFRLGLYIWLNKQKRYGERMCVLCNGIESGYHLLFDCEGINVRMRAEIYSSGLHTLDDVLNVRDACKAKMVGDFLEDLLQRRLDRL